MAKTSQQVLHATAAPRIIAYALAAALLACSALAQPLPPLQWLLAAATLAYPLLVALGIRALPPGALPAAPVMAVDGLAVAALAWLLLDSLLAASAVLMMLVASALLVLPPARALGVAAACGALTALAALWLPRPQLALNDELVNPAAFLAIGSYWYCLGYIVFRELVQRSRELKARGQRESHLTQLGRHLASYLPPQVVDAGSVRRRFLTVFFSDIHGFTRMMDSMDEQAVADMINEYFDLMTQIALDQGGTLDKFVGDGMLVFFGDPQSKGRREDALACLRMAAEMQSAARALAARLSLPIAVRMGVHSGLCMVGSFGACARRDYTALGSVVNIASRLEGRAKPGQVLLSQDTARLVRPQLPLAPGPTLRLKGIAQPVPTSKLPLPYRNGA